MPVRRRWLDPETRDYVLISGGPQGDDTRMGKVLIRIFTELGSIPLAGLETIGSRLHQLQKATPSAARTGEGFIYDCLADLVATKEITRLLVIATITVIEGTTAIAFSVSFYDAGDGDVRQIKWNKTFGGGR